jgi:hypothetical protein
LYSLSKLAERKRANQNMIRNHLIDPESSPPPRANPGAFHFQSAYDNSNQQQQNYGNQQQQYGVGAGVGAKSNEDQWYNSTGRESPMYSYGGAAGASSSYHGAGDQGQYSNAFAGASMATDPIDDDYENEPPLLEELGIHFDHIWSKTQAVINIRQEISEHILDDADLAGPLVFCLLLGACLLLRGKVVIRSYSTVFVVLNIFSTLF